MGVQRNKYLGLHERLQKSLKLQGYIGFCQSSMEEREWKTESRHAAEP